MEAIKYLKNIGVALRNVGRATAGIYRPNGHTYFVSWWYCVDCLGNAVAGGDPLETISSRAGKAQNEGRAWGCRLCGFLALVTGAKHCDESIDPNAGQNAVIPD